MAHHARLQALSFALTSVFAIAAPTPAAAQSIDDAIAEAAREAAVIGTEWLGPRKGDATLTVRRPLWQGRGAMFVERQAATEVIRAWWPAAIPDATADSILDGFAWYLQGQAIERVYDRRYLRLAHSLESRSYLGDQVIWSFPTLRLSRSAVMRRDRYATTFQGLERWVGISTLQGAMSAVARLRAEQLTAAQMIETISGAAGQDLSWAFAAADGGDLNYAVTDLSSSDASGCAARCIDTSVKVIKEGDAIFSGRSAGRAGRFDSGDAILLTVAFEDGTSASVRWDGRDPSRTFRFRGPSRASAAYLDPDHVVTLDRNRLDNARVTPVPTNVPVRKWVARWMVWLQHTMLSYGFLA